MVGESTLDRKEHYRISFKVQYIQSTSYYKSCDMLQITELAKLKLNISAPDTRLQLSSSLMADSFFKYQWKESLPSILFKLMPEMALESAVDDFGDPQKCPAGGVPDVHACISFLNSRRAIPTASNSQSIFLFAGLKNCTVAVCDTINANLILEGHSAVSHLLCTGAAC
jgi:hypothetical protein